MAQKKWIHLPSVADANIAQCGAKVSSGNLRFPALDATTMCLDCFTARLKVLNAGVPAAASSTMGA